MKLTNSIILIILMWISISPLAAGDSGSALYNDILTSLSESDLKEVKGAVDESKNNETQEKDGDREVQVESVSESQNREALERAADAEKLPEDLKDKVMQRIKEMEKERKTRPVEFREKE